MSNIEDDMKVMKEFVDVDRKMRQKEVESDYDKFCEKICIAIENVLSEREQDKARIKELEEEITEHVYWESTPLKQIEQYYIPKQKVKKKISEAKHNRKYANTAYEYTEEDVWDIVKDNLEELLEEGE